MIKTKENKSLLIALTLGDGSIYVAKDTRWKNSWHSKFSLCHSIKQLDFVKYKVSLLENILGKNINIRIFNNSGFPGCGITVSAKYFRILKRFMYLNGKKRITKSILNKLTPKGIAIWYMDDGSLTLHKRNGKIHSRAIYLNTYCPLEEAKIVQQYFLSVWGINFRIQLHKNLYRLVCNTQETKKFISLVYQYIIPSMKYKVDMKYDSGDKNYFIPVESHNLCNVG